MGRPALDDVGNVSSFGSGPGRWRRDTCPAAGRCAPQRAGPARPRSGRGPRPRTVPPRPRRPDQRPRAGGSRTGGQRVQARHFSCMFAGSIARFLSRLVSGITIAQKPAVCPEKFCRGRACPLDKRAVSMVKCVHQSERSKIRMRFHTYGDPTMPPVMLIHGGGNAWWNYLRQARALSERYHVILPTLDGHGEEFATPYISTERTADELLGLHRHPLRRASVCPGRGVSGAGRSSSSCCPAGRMWPARLSSTGACAFPAGAGSFLHRVGPAVWPVDVQRKSLPLAAGP